MTEKTSQLSIASNLIPIIERGAAMVFPGQGAQSSGMGRKVSNTLLPLEKLMLKLLTI